MDYCFICGVSEEKAKLFDAISEEGIAKICERCSFDEGIPLIKRPTTFQLKESERPRGSVYERMKNVSGFKEREDRVERARKFGIEKKDVSLRDIVDKSYKKDVPKKIERTDLVDNFHWAVMTGRRRKKLSQKQLAEQIGESEDAIKMAEQGILPNDENKLAKKLETFLEVMIIKRKIIEPTISVKREGVAEISFEPLPQKEPRRDLTIEDLKEMRKRKEEELMNRNLEKKEVSEESGEDEPELLEKKKIKDLSDDEIRKLIFKR